MMNYRRNYIKGGKYFFTVTLRDRQSKLLIDEVDLLKNAMKLTQLNHPYLIEAVVVLPDHIHAVWRLPEDDANYSLRWGKIKSYFTRGLQKLGYKLEKNNRNEYKNWQRRFWEHTIIDERDFEAHVNYIHYNPVKHGLVERPLDWPYSSFHRYVHKGLLPKDWGGFFKEKNRCYGE
jgi:putative transposase